MVDISKLAKYVTSLDKYTKGSVVFFDGLPSNDKMFILIEGTAKVYKNYGLQGEICFATLGPGDFFGEMSLFLDRERTATIVAAEDISMFVINRTDIIDFLKHNPDIAFSFLQTLCARLDITNVNAAINLVKYEQGLKVLNQGLAALNKDNSKLEIAVSADPLTGIHNRRYFLENAAAIVEISAIREMHPFIVYFDLDHFKSINDTYGHSAGDQVLIAVSNLVSASTRPGDIFARYGGEEFILLINCDRPADIMHLVERIRINIGDELIEYDGMEIRVTVSIGVAPVLSHAELDTAINQADQALYKAKAEGRNRAVLYKEA